MEKDTNQISILIVEDSPIQAELLRRLIVSHGYLCQVATDGEAGLMKLKENRPHLVISDIQMPVLDGYQMCERIKSDPQFKNIPVILLTALSDPVDVIRGLNAGAEAYLTKPYDNERLLAQVRRLLSATPIEDKVTENKPLDVEINDAHYSVNASREKILQMLVSTYGNAAHQNQLLQKLEEDLHSLNQQLETKVAQRTASLVEEEKRARNAENRYKTLFDLMPEGVGILDTQEWKFIEFNDVACGQLGYLRSEFEKRSILDLALDNDKAKLLEHLNQALRYPQTSFTTQFLAQDQGLLDMDVRTRLIELDGQRLLNCIFRDMTAINRAKKIEWELEHKSTHDLITDLPSKTLLLDAITQSIHIADRNSSPITVLAIDLNRLNTITASLGHPASDAIQVELAQRLRAIKPKAGMVARIHNQDFIYLVDGSLDPSPITELLTRISRATSTPFNWNGAMLEFEPCIGVSVYPKDAQDANSLLESAEAALFKAKESGRKAIVLASPELKNEVENLIRKENELRSAFANGQLEMFYQPRVDLITGKISGAEALMRWRDPIKGIIPPKDFIPLAEEIGLIRSMTEWALSEVCKQQKKWSDSGIDIVPISVNLVAEQFQDDQIIKTLKTSLDESRLPAKFLEVELTESAAMQDPKKTAQLLNQIRDLGILIAIDDFGTGYSSLAYLEKFPIDILKIDISFVQGVTKDLHSIAITSAIIAMAKELKFLIVAEGVEIEGQREFLSSHHCEEGQGYLFSQPVPADTFKQLLINKVSY
ncbi:GGDEF/EAL domain-containing response regulator [Polynucleobacter sphagniphilus]|jgi:diguanylate cyclase (GGDEF)-like protein/PAS domain S-box-containing protein|uniref:Diguanylate cyclase (GGDEF)-like protein/PAS domain S-box-containing protein n=1 Tax=Polynucleobacter sphagniphilus TaxID=1743169 RepID=A0AA43S5G0_9BURK|nr:EAL domain-containing protein [Polynucleobacter sphagniphilus]MDH6504310.1 diguanylate cyclase (GGDEF)-like protein/PAS domain S-box-containing protein [Polynucleobacter sphagniphilus]MDH6512132.1 diguanylate cyclase (GGDEF)-like protein/PAS domain S-box-containing protein [Polynucleobacter sphagniphilus]